MPTSPPCRDCCEPLSTSANQADQTKTRQAPVPRSSRAPRCPDNEAASPLRVEHPVGTPARRRSSSFRPSLLLLPIVQVIELSQGFRLLNTPPLPWLELL